MNVANSLPTTGAGLAQGRSSKGAGWERPRKENMARLLLVDPDDSFRIPLAQRLRSSQHEVEVHLTAEEALRSLRRGTFALVLSGLSPASPAGLELLEATKLLSPNARFWLLGDNGGQWCPQGVEDLIPRTTDPQALARRIELLLGSPELAGQGLLEPSVPFSVTPPELAGSSPVMEELRRQISKLASLDAALLVAGETGSGKELVARVIHRASPRRDQPFAVVHCSGFPEVFLEDQLFGSGPEPARRGALEAAGRGTVLIDEGEALPLGLQARVFRALEENEVLPRGTPAPRAISSRMIFATRASLRRLADSGAFHEGLYSRLASFEIQIPPLRSRKGDLERTALALLEKHARQKGRTVPRLSTAAWAALEQYSWPGNVRELASVLERALVLVDGPLITAGDLPSSFRPPPDLAGSNLREARRAFEQNFVLRVLDECGGDKVRAARELGIGLASLYRKIEESSRQNRRPARHGGPSLTPRRSPAQGQDPPQRLG